MSFNQDRHKVDGSISSTPMHAPFRKYRKIRASPGTFTESVARKYVKSSLPDTYSRSNVLDSPGVSNFVLWFSPDMLFLWAESVMCILNQKQDSKDAIDRSPITMNLAGGALECITTGIP